MKINSLFIISIMCLLLTSCAVIQTKNIEKCNYSYKSISDIQINDVQLKKGALEQTWRDLVSIPKSIKKEDGLKVSCTANVNVENPTKRKARIIALKWILCVKDVVIADGTIDKKISIPAHQTVVVPISVKTDLNRIKNFSLGDIKDIAIDLLKYNDFPPNTTLKVCPIKKVGKKTVSAPTYYTIKIN